MKKSGIVVFIICMVLGLFLPVSAADKVAIYHGNGKLLGYRKGSDYYYTNNETMTSNDALEMKCYEKAQEKLSQITTNDMSKEQKLRAAHDWCATLTYKTYREIDFKEGWTAVHALDAFDKDKGNCFAYACAFGYMAITLGYTEVYACSNSNVAGKGHCWIEIDGLVYDPQGTQSKNKPGIYFGRTYGEGWEENYPYSPVTRVLLPYLSPKHKSTTTVDKKKNGLIKENGAYYFYTKGVKLKNKWKTIKKNKYYFKSDGKAATLSTKINKTYYVFYTNGKLVKTKKTKTFTIKGSVYRVNKKGQAVKGWQKVKKVKTYYYAANGKRVTGVYVMSGQMHYFSSKGIYSAKKTKEISKAAKEESSIAPLLKILGEPKKKTYQDSCYGEGQDGLWEYENITISTFKPADGTDELYMGLM